MFLGWETPRGDEAKDESADGDAEPEARGYDAGSEVRAVADAEHEDDDPAADADFCTDVEEQEDGGEDRDAVVDGCGCGAGCVLEGVDLAQEGGEGTWWWFWLA